MKQQSHTREKTTLRQLLATSFNDSELRDLCYDLNIEYEDLPGQTKRDKAREMIVFMERRRRTSELIARCRELRPNLDWPEVQPILPDITLTRSHRTLFMLCVLLFVSVSSIFFFQGFVKPLPLNTSGNAISPTPALQHWPTVLTDVTHTMTVINHMSDTPLPVGYPVPLRLDSQSMPTAADLYGASLTNNKGDDIRVVYQGREIPRHIRIFSPTVIEIWFATQQELPAGNIATGYTLYSSNAQATNPNFGPSDIFIPHRDDFTRLLFYFDEGQGDQVIDYSGQNNHGLLEGTIPKVWPEGKIGTGLHFDDDLLVQVPDSEGLRMTNQLAIEAWIRPSRIDNYTRNIVAKIAPSNGPDRLFAYRMFLRNGTLIFSVYGPQGEDKEVLSPKLLEANRWYHIAGLYDGNTLRLFIDGEEVKSESHTKPINPAHTWLAIGSSGYREEFFAGDIDMVKISAKAEASFPYARVTANPVARINP